MMAHGGVKVQLHLFLTSIADTGKWSASCHSFFIPRERATSTHWKGGWM